MENDDTETKRRGEWWKAFLFEVCRFLSEHHKTKTCCFILVADWGSENNSWHYWWLGHLIPEVVYHRSILVTRNYYRHTRIHPQLPWLPSCLVRAFQKYRTTLRLCLTGFFDTFSIAFASPLRKGRVGKHVCKLLWNIWPVGLPLKWKQTVLPKSS